MATIQVTEKNFEATAKRGIVLLDFWAAWRGSRAFTPVLEAAAWRHLDVVFGKIDVQDEPRLAAAFQISAIPSLAVLRDGALLQVRTGGLSAADLDELIAEARTADMRRVRRALDDRRRPRAAGLEVR